MPISRRQILNRFASGFGTLGLDHEKLTDRYSGRDFRLPDVSGKVVREILA